VVSEETQNVSLVQHGALTAVNDEIALRTSLRAIFVSKDQSLNWKSAFFKS